MVKGHGIISAQCHVLVAIKAIALDDRESITRTSRWLDVQFDRILQFQHHDDNDVLAKA